MRESDERPWGRYEVLEESDGYKVKRLEVKPGARLSLQRHSRRGEHWSSPAPPTLSAETEPYGSIKASTYTSRRKPIIASATAQTNR